MWILSDDKRQLINVERVTKFTCEDRCVRAFFGSHEDDAVIIYDGYEIGDDVEYLEYIYENLKDVLKCK